MVDLGPWPSPAADAPSSLSGSSQRVGRGAKPHERADLTDEASTLTELTAATLYMLSPRSCTRSFSSRPRTGGISRVLLRFPPRTMQRVAG